MSPDRKPRIERLRSAVDDYVRRAGSRIILSADERAAFARLAHKAYASSRSLPEVMRKAKFLRVFAEEMPVSIADDELIVGSQRFTGRSFEKFLGAEASAAMAFHGNIGHIIVDYGRVLHEGVGGLRQRILRMDAGPGVKERNRAAFLEALEAFSVFIRRHADAARQRGLLKIADNCEWIAQNAPRTFWEALQLVWFVQVFLHAEGLAAAVSFGRFDQFLWPFLERDLRAGVATLDAAEELLSCFWLKCCEGDESQNLTVGGVDEHGRSAENPLSLLCLQVTRKLKVWQPSLSVRIGPDTSDEFWRGAL
ncbi:MAG: hypothetical protein FJ272_15935, partial [Planctomycetes bacterium]|nr:hypothetical protein [Planctomycetota bacterium]